MHMDHTLVWSKVAGRSIDNKTAMDKPASEIMHWNFVIQRSAAEGTGRDSAAEKSFGRAE